MKIYKIAYWCNVESSEGFEYVGNKKDAEKLSKKYIAKHPETHSTEIEILNIIPKKSNIISALNIHGGHNDNG